MDSLAMVHDCESVGPSAMKLQARRQRLNVHADSILEDCNFRGSDRLRRRQFRCGKPCVYECLKDSASICDCRLDKNVEVECVTRNAVCDRRDSADDDVFCSTRA